MLTAQNIHMTLDETPVLHDVTFQVDHGACFGIIGPNGSGKSTLLKILSGYLEPTRGTVYLEGKNIRHISQKKLARKMAVLSQEALYPYPMAVVDAVSMGRYPHLKWYEREKEDDIAKVSEVMKATNVEHFQHKTLDTLSGGERQRVAIAKAMAQNPDILLLDEPTTYLDIHHQLALLEMIQQWKSEEGITVIIVLHDLNLASQFCDKLLLLNNGQIEVIGKSEEVITEKNILKVYETKPEVIPHPIHRVPQVLLTKKGLIK
ncbi:heme ABC transporter ATP-binding protein [Salirhabdus salicampi]|uniref:heme ABC transporter ATP-binding protein n=1 Tax=Salirhabdus salicampi TaxID=476102 RepID=UPI0020C3BD79|nr:heme ABC transporter ATP-binding protein [Salirhabdus salicampi]MCP8618109.1 heme ABC transporter ATP-binding protein [Salirhabdus salicampi]